MPARTLKVAKKATLQKSDAFLTSISDVELQEKVLALVEENKRLKLSLTVVEAEKRALTAAAEKKTLAEVAPAKRPRGRPLKRTDSWQLTTGDVAALKHAISQDFVKRRGWRLGKSGELLDLEGRVVHGPGYLQGIKKVLANALKAVPDDAAEGKK